MDQPTFADLEYESKKRETRREIFLERMNSLIPWEQLEERIRPFYPKEGRGRRPYELSAMLRIHCVQLFYNLSDCQGRRHIRPCGVAVQDKCPFKWPAEMSPGQVAMVSDVDPVGPAQGCCVGGPSAARYFLMVALWIPNSRSIALSDIPLRLAF